MDLTTADGHKTIYYIGDYEYIESDNGIKEIHYINGVSGLDAVYIINDDMDANSGNIYFTTKDYLGSITAIFDDNNNLVDENSFDPWGRKRNPHDWSYDMSYKSNMTLADLTDRGLYRP